MGDGRMIGVDLILEPAKQLNSVRDCELNEPPRLPPQLFDNTLLRISRLSTGSVFGIGGCVPPQPLIPTLP